MEAVAFAEYFEQAFVVIDNGGHSIRLERVPGLLGHFVFKRACDRTAKLRDRELVGLRHEGGE